jgi:hypothetical protein
LYNPKWRIVWSAGAAVATAVMVGADWLLRSGGGRSFLAPSAADLWLSVALGLALGGAAALWERYLLSNQRGHLRAFHRAPLRERLAWHHQRTNLLLNGWLVVALLALIGWCVAWGVFVLPALLAVNAAQFACNARLAGRFDEELRRRAA